MKFAIALMAIGAQAIKLHQEEEQEQEQEEEEYDCLMERFDAMHAYVDWNGSGDVDAEEIKDLAYAAEAFGYITPCEAEDYYEDADLLLEAFGGPITPEDIEAALDGNHEGVD